MSVRFSYVKYDQKSMEVQAKLRAQFEAIETTLAELPDGRPKSLCLTALEEAYMWTGKAVRDAQIARTGQVDEQPERSAE
jgi:hypothetical protein